MSTLFIFPILLFVMAILALVSGLGVFWTLRDKRAGLFTTFIWTIFSASILIGFMTFGMFLYVTQDDVLLAAGVSLIGIIAVMASGKLATL